MCDKCVELDKKIERYRRLSSSLADQNDNRPDLGANRLIAHAKVELHPERKPKGRPSGLPLPQVRRSTRASLTEAAPASPARLTSRNSVLPSGTARCGSSEKPTLDSVRKLWPLAKSSGH